METILALRNMTSFKMLNATIKEDSGKDFTSYGQNQNPLVIVTGLTVTLPLVQVHNRGIPEVLLYDTLFPHGLE